MRKGPWNRRVVHEMEDNAWGGEGHGRFLVWGKESTLPPLYTGPFRGAELGRSTSPHSLEAEAPGSVNGGSAQGQH